MDSQTQHNAPLRVTRGNDFVVVATLRQQTGDRTQDVDLSTITDLKATLFSLLGGRVELAFEASGTELRLAFTADLPAGSYGLELTGKTSTGCFRYFDRPHHFVDLVEATADESQPAADESRAYNITLTLGLAMANASDIRSINGQMRTLQRRVATLESIAAYNHPQTQGDAAAT